jgi:hypothetical protein
MAKNDCYWDDLVESQHSALVGIVASSAVGSSAINGSPKILLSSSYYHYLVHKENHDEHGVENDQLSLVAIDHSYCSR